MAALKKGQAWATTPVQIPFEHVGYYCDVDQDRRRFVEYAKWRPILAQDLKDKQIQYTEAELADATLELLGYTDRNTFPTRQGLEVLRARKASAAIVRRQTVLTKLLYQNLQRLRRPEQRNRSFADEDDKYFDFLLRLMRQVDLAKAFPATRSQARVSGEDLVARLRQGDFTWFGEDFAEVDGKDDRGHSPTADSHRQLLVLASAALRSGDDRDLHAFTGVPLPESSAPVRKIHWPVGMTPESLLAGLTPQFFGTRSLERCFAGVQACMHWARNVIVQDSEDVAIHIMDVWKKIADDAMAKYRPYLSDEDGDANVEACTRQAQEVLLAPKLPGRNTSEPRVHYTTAVPPDVAHEISEHARQRLLAAVMAPGVSTEVAEETYKNLMEQLERLQRPRAKLLTHWDIGSSSPIQISTRLIRAGCGGLPKQYNLAPEVYFRYATARRTDMLSQLTLYLEHSYVIGQPAQLIHDDAQFWNGFHHWLLRITHLHHEEAASLLLRGSLGRCCVIYGCPHCHSDKTEYQDLQTRSADEEHVYVIFCLACGKTSDPQ